MVHGPVKVYMINFKYILITLLVKHSILENPSVESFYFWKMKTKMTELKKKLWELQTPNVLMDFCESTTLHGYNYFHIANSVLAKTVWAIIILLATGTGLNFLVINTKAYMKATITTSIESSSDNLHVSNQRLNFKLQRKINQFSYLK